MSLSQRYIVMVIGEDGRSDEITLEPGTELDPHALGHGVVTGIVLLEQARAREAP